MSASTKRHENEIPVDEALARRLLVAQFPAFAKLPLRLVTEQGTDHTLFRLGDDMVLRLPIMEYASRQAVRHAQWVPFLAPQVPLELPRPIALGQPTEEYPVQWSIVGWIEGERATADNIEPVAAARDLARFINALHACDPAGGPEAGRQTGLRGLSLKPWDTEVREWIAKADDSFDLRPAVAMWEEVMAAPEWDRPPVWFHGDLSWNLIGRDGRLVGAIDSGYGVGDPACDLMPGWTLFRGEARRVFFGEVGLDEATVMRSRGWALGPAFIGVTYYKDVPELRANAIRAIEGALED